MKQAGPLVVLKIDVDTERGTRIGVPMMAGVLKLLEVPASFLFALGPDNTGRAIRRVLRPGFLKKVSRTSVMSIYGFRTLMNGVLLPGPQVAKRHSQLMQRIQAGGFEVGIHCYDHVRWQDGVTTMPQEQIATDFNKAVELFKTVFQTPPKVAGAPGWQANEKTLTVYDAAGLKYASDARGRYPFFPRVGDQVFRTLQIPTTLPTLDELLGRPEFPLEKLTDHYLSLLDDEHPNIFTVHAELEGMHYRGWFTALLRRFKKEGIRFATLGDVAHEVLTHPERVHVSELIQGDVEGRSGTMAMQGFDDDDLVYEADLDRS